MQEKERMCKSVIRSETGEEGVLMHEQISGSVSPGIWEIQLFFRHLQTQNTSINVLILSLCTGLAGILNPSMTVYNPRVTIYSCPPPFLSWGEVRINPPPPPTAVWAEFWWSALTKKYWIEIKGSSVLTWLPHWSVDSLWFSPHHLHLQHLTSSTSTEKE